MKTNLYAGGAAKVAVSILILAQAGLAAGAELSLQFSTYLGGANAHELGRDIATDAQGNIYVVGGTGSSDYPTTPGAYCRTHMGKEDVFVTKFSPSGQIIFSTLIGGSGHDRAYQVEVNSSGEVYIGGHCGGDTYPVTPGAMQNQPSGSGQDAFVTRLSADGSRLISSTLWGPTGTTAYGRVVRGLSLDSAGNVYCGSYHPKNSGAYPPQIASRFRNSFAGPIDKPDSVVFRLSADFSSCDWAWFLGGTGAEWQNVSVCVNEASNTVFACGRTQSTDFPVTPNAFQSTLGGTQDFFLVRIAFNGALLAATIIGGSGFEDAETNVLALTPSGNPVIVATSNSTDFPTTPNAYSRTFGGSGGSNGNYKHDIVVATLSADLTTQLAGTYISASSGQGGEGIGVDKNGNVYVAGVSYGNNFPVTSDAFQRVLGGGSTNPYSDAVLIKLSPDLSTIRYATYLGGKNEDYARGLALDPQGNVVLTGSTRSTNFPVLNALDTTLGRNQDTYVAKFTPNTGTTNLAPVIESAAFANPNPVTFPGTTNVSIVASDPDNGPAALTYTWSKLSGPGTVSFSPNGTTASDISTATFGAAGSYSLKVLVSDGQDIVTDIVTVTVNGGTSSTTVKIYTSPGDGIVYYEGASGEAWNVVRDAATGTHADATSPARDINVSNYSATNRYEIRRGFFAFDASSIPVTASIQSAALKVYVNAKVNGDNDGEDFIVAVSSAQASTATLATQDYARSGMVEWSGRRDFGTIATGAYASWSLNAQGLSAINRNGFTKIGLREGHDLLHRPIAPGKTNKIAINFSESSGTTKGPYLEVTYTP